MVRYGALESSRKGKMLWNRVLLSIFAFCIPFSVVIAADNLLLRMPQFIHHEFDQEDVEELTGKSLEKGAVSGSISDFFRGSEPLSLTVEERGKDQELFLPQEQSSMERLRRMLNLASVAGGGALAIGAAVCAGFIWRGYKEAVRVFFKRGAAFFAMWILLSGGLLLIPGVREWIGSVLLDLPFPEGGILELLLTPVFLRNFVFVRTAAAAAILAVLWAVVRNYTKPRRMFW